MEKSSFFNSISGDRRYKAEHWAEYFASFIGNGVFPQPSTGLQVVAGVGMNVVIKPGKAWINGYFYINDSELILPLSTADGVLKRNDRIVLRWDLTYRAITARVKSSLPASSPTPPPPQRDADAYEIVLADVNVNAGVTNLTLSNITDQRWETELCGVVAGVVQQIDPTFITTQFNAFFAEYKPRIEADYTAYVQSIQAYQARFKQDTALTYADYEAFVNLYKQYVAVQYNSFIDILNNRKTDSTAAYNALLEWFNSFKVDSQANIKDLVESIKGILGEDEAGNLLNMIQQLQARQPTATIGTIQHNLDRYPQCTLYRVPYAYGVGGYGAGGYGGGNLLTVPAEFELIGKSSVAVITLPEFAQHTNAQQLEANMYSFSSSEPDATESLILILY